MATIKTDFGAGGVPMTPTGVDSQPTLAQTLRDVADDLAAVKGSTIAAPATLAFTDPPSPAEMALLRTLVNEMRTALIATGGATLKTLKG